MRTWSAVQAALEERPGWHRRGREYHGPCPVLGVGEDCCWFAQGEGSGGVRVGCRRCGGRLSGSDVRAHLDALCGPPPAPGSTGRPGRPATRPKPATAGLPDAVWRESGPVQDTPGLVYLKHRGVWPGRPVGSVRWLTAAATRRVRLRPGLPDGASGCLVYRFAVPAELVTMAVQVEAVGADGARLEGWRVWDPERGCEVLRRTKRAGVAGSDFAAARRVFAARSSAPPAAGVHVCEGPLDALALLSLEYLGVLDLHGAAVLGVAGTSGLQAAAVAGWRGPVTLRAQDDRASVLRMLRLGFALRYGRRTVRVVRPAEGLTGTDWGDLAVIENAERKAMRDG